MESFQWRKDHVRCSDKIVELGEYALAHYSSHLGNEKWAVYEQVHIDFYCLIDLIEYSGKEGFARGTIYGIT